MKVLMLSTDRNAFSENSHTRNRFIEYGNLFDQLHIIVFTEDGYSNEKISENVFLYPTNSFSKLFYIFNAFFIGKKIKDIDIITAQDPFEVGFSGFMISRYLKKKLHIQVHTDLFSPYFKNTSFLNRIRIVISRFILRRADGIRVVSERIKESIVARNISNADKIEVLPIFVDAKNIMSELPRFSLKDKYPQFDFFVITVARLEREKNINLSLRAMDKVIKQYPKICFLLVGDGGERDSLEREVSRLGLDKNVIFEGGKRDVISYYKTANVYLCSSNYEGYGLSLVEAALSGCPIITTDVGIANYILKNNEGALISLPNDLLGLRNNILKIILDGELRKEIKRVAMAETLKNSYSDKKEYMDLYLKSLQIQ